MKTWFFPQLELGKRAKMLNCHFTVIVMFWKTFRVNVSKYQIYEAAEIENRVEHAGSLESTKEA